MKRHNISVIPCRQIMAGVSARTGICNTDMKLRVPRNQHILYVTNIASPQTFKKAFSDRLCGIHIRYGIAYKDDTIHIFKNHIKNSLILYVIALLLLSSSDRTPMLNYFFQKAKALRIDLFQLPKPKFHPAKPRRCIVRPKQHRYIPRFRLRRQF